MLQDFLGNHNKIRCRLRCISSEDGSAEIEMKIFASLCLILRSFHVSVAQQFRSSISNAFYVPVNSHFFLLLWSSLFCVHTWFYTMSMTGYAHCYREYAGKMLSKVSTMLEGRWDASDEKKKVLRCHQTWETWIVISFMIFVCAWRREIVKRRDKQRVPRHGDAKLASEKAFPTRESLPARQPHFNLISRRTASRVCIAR